MKSCPSCDRTYADETLTFCLVDGAILSAPYDPLDTVRIPSAQITAPAPTQTPNTSPQQPVPNSQSMATIQSSGPPPFYSAKQLGSARSLQTSKQWLILTLFVSLFVILFVGAIAGFLWLGSNGSDGEAIKTNNTNTSVSPSPAPTTKPTASPTPPVNEGEWGPRNDQAGLNGERLTYYPGSTPEKCQADCDVNPRCKAYTLIRAGFYNPSDPPMCYLMSVATEFTPSPCCISAVKR